MLDTALEIQDPSVSHIQQPVLSGRYEQNIYHIVLRLVEGMIVASIKETTNLDQDAINFATEKYWLISKKNCKTIINPVHRYMVVDKSTSIIGYIHVEEPYIPDKEPKKNYWMLKSNLKLSDGNVIDQSTGKIITTLDDLADKMINENGNQIRCLHTGVQTIEEYFKKARTCSFNKIISLIKSYANDFSIKYINKALF